MPIALNDIESLKKTYGSYLGESLAANAVMNLCDEVVTLRIALKAMLMATVSYSQCDEELRKAHDLCWKALGDS